MYYAVDAKCGHVGKNNYIVKTFYVEADSGKDAAKIVRAKPRVKHDQKDAIRKVRKITLDEYSFGVEAMKEDPYFNVYNSSDQRRFELDGIIREDFFEEVRERQVQFKLRKWKLIEKESRRMLLGAYYG